MASLGRSSAMIAAGTLASRVTGLVRTMVLVLVIGNVTRPADAFTTANQLPNMIYGLISAGLLTAVVVPQIVKAAQHTDGGRAFISKLFTLGTVALVVITGLATLAAPVLVWLFSGGPTGKGYTPDQFAMATALAYWCIPQLLFYGLFALIGETFNARRVYGPYTWAPIANNVISIAGFLAFLLIFETPMSSVADWTPGRIAWLGGIATGGIIVQFLVLLAFWKKADLKLRPDFRWRGVGLGEIGKLAGWTFLMVLVSTVAGWVQATIVAGASGEGPAATALANAWLIYVLPYSIIVLSIGTPYFTRISEHAAAERTVELKRDIDASIRTLGVFIVLATAAIAAAVIPAARIVSSDRAEAILTAPVLLAYLANLIPVAILFIIQRTFYVYGDTRTPFLFTLLQAVLVAGTAGIAALLERVGVLPIEYLGAAVALGQTTATAIQTIVAIVLLRRRIGSLHMRNWLTAYARFIVAGIPAGLAGWGVYLLCGGNDGWFVRDTGTTVFEKVGGQLAGALGVVVIGAVAAVVYIAVLALVRAPELKIAVDTVRRKLGR